MIDLKQSIYISNPPHDLIKEHNEDHCLLEMGWAGYSEDSPVCDHVNRPEHTSQSDLQVQDYTQYYLFI